jgi:hypothetical protein
MGSERACVACKWRRQLKYIVKGIWVGRTSILAALAGVFGIGIGIGTGITCMVGGLTGDGLFRSVYGPGLLALHGFGVLLFFMKEGSFVDRKSIHF